MFETFKAARTLKDVQERMESLERTVKTMKLEWEDTYDRLTKILQRFIKRAEVVERAATDASSKAGDLGVATSDEGSTGGLSDAARKANAEILARRNRRAEVKQ